MFFNGNNLGMFSQLSKNITVSTVFEKSDSGLILPLGTKPREDKKKEETKEENK